MGIQNILASFFGRTPSVKAANTANASTGYSSTSDEHKVNSGNSENDLVETKISEGQLKFYEQEGSKPAYVYTANGRETYGEIKESLGLASGVLRENNARLFKDIEGNADYVAPPEGTRITIYPEDLPDKPANYNDDSGNRISGLYEDHDGSLYYKVQSGDTASSIGEKLSCKSLKYYDTADAMRGYPESNLQVGTKVPIHEKGPIGKFFAWIFG